MFIKLNDAFTEDHVIYINKNVIAYVHKPTSIVATYNSFVQLLPLSNATDAPDSYFYVKETPEQIMALMGEEMCYERITTRI